MEEVYLLVRLVKPVRVEEDPRLERRPRWPVGEVTDEEVVVAVEEVEELRSSCLLPKEPLKGHRCYISDQHNRSAFFCQLFYLHASPLCCSFAEGRLKPIRHINLMSLEAVFTDSPENKLSHQTQPSVSETCT